MKKIYVSAAAVTGLLLGGSMSCFAGESVFSDLKPYVGVEAIQTSMKFKDRFGSNIFKKNPVDYNIFAGLNFTEMFGVEAGFESHKKLKRTATIGGGGYVPQNGIMQTLPQDTSFGYSTTFKSYHPYLGVTVSHNFANIGLCNTNVHFMLGASFSKIKGEQNLLFGQVTGQPAALTQNDLQLFGFDIINTYKKSKVILMIKVGLSQAITQHVLIKGSVNWKEMSKFNVNSLQDSIATIKLKDSYGFGISFIYTL